MSISLYGQKKGVALDLSRPLTDILIKPGSLLTNPSGSRAVGMIDAGVHARAGKSVSPSRLGCRLSKAILAGLCWRLEH